MKRYGGSKTPGERVLPTKVFTVVVNTNIRGTESDVSDSVKWINNNYFNHIEKSVGKGNVGDNIKDNVFTVNRKTGEQLYIKAATLTQSGLRAMGNTSLDEMMSQLTRQIGSQKGIDPSEVKLQIVDESSLKGSDLIGSNSIHIEDLKKAVFSNNIDDVNIDERDIDGHTVMFNINKQFGDKSNSEKRVGFKFN